MISAAARVERVRDGYMALEGPLGTLGGDLFFSDINANLTYRMDAGGSIAVWRENTQGTNGMYLLADGRFVAAESRARRIVAIDAGTKHVTPLATAYNGMPLRNPNDLIADSKGGIYFTDPPPRQAPTSGEVYYVRPTGEVVLLDNQIRFPNGLSLSIDQKTLYVDDSDSDSVYAFDVQPDGAVRNKRVYAKVRELVTDQFGTRSRADGMAIDAAGRLYLGTGVGVQVIGAGGTQIGTIRMPAIIRNVAFGGAARRTLYMTAADALYRVELLAQGPPGRSK